MLGGRNIEPTTCFTFVNVFWYPTIGRPSSCIFFYINTRHAAFKNNAQVMVNGQSVMVNVRPSYTVRRLKRIIAQSTADHV